MANEYEAKIESLEKQLKNFDRRKSGLSAKRRQKILLDNDGKM